MARMYGGLAVRANLLCVTWSSGRGRVLLFDLDARELLSQWTIQAPPAGYSDASSVAMDEHFHLFIADTTNNRVRHYSAFGRHLADIGLPPGEQGQAHRDRPGVLDRPHAVAVFDDTLYVACGERPQRRSLQRFWRDGRVQKPLLPQGDSDGLFGAPRGVWVDAAGVLLADTLHGQLLRFRHNGVFVAAAPTASSPRAMSRPHALLRLADGSVLFVEAGDEPGLRSLSKALQPRALPGDLAERVQQPVAFAVDDQQRLYVLDHHGDRVQRFCGDGRFDATVVELPEYLDGAAPEVT
jgi:hypothetical protein